MREYTEEEKRLDEEWSEKQLNELTNLARATTYWGYDFLLSPEGENKLK